MQESFVSEQEQLRLVQLGLNRLYKIFERVCGRCEAERADIRELGAALSALGAAPAAEPPAWLAVRGALKTAAHLATTMGETSIEEMDYEYGAGAKILLALDALGAYRELCARLSRGLHGERAAAAAAQAHSAAAAAAAALRKRHRFALHCCLEESGVVRAYALAALQSLHSALRAHGAAHAHCAAVWTDLHSALAHT
ncbi:PREDICTED: sorting nexin-8-like [Papilio polytes]|uniref:sorting nexin-8-like n=1 Tax=Papilio polytes TaxID=76194 RepID=UPI00067640A4|nr:PREDICTED: sorting nexin-8-like [Papilio polytes]